MPKGHNTVQTSDTLISSLPLSHHSPHIMKTDLTNNSGIFYYNEHQFNQGLWYFILRYMAFDKYMFSTMNIGLTKNSGI